MSNLLRQITYPDQWNMKHESPSDIIANIEYNMEMIEKLQEQEELYAQGKTKQKEQISEGLKPVTELLKASNDISLRKFFH